MLIGEIILKLSIHIIGIKITHRKDYIKMYSNIEDESKVYIGKHINLIGALI